MPQHDDERWTVRDCALHLGISESTWRGYVARSDAGAPRPVARIGATPLWDPREVAAWNDSRPGRGGRPRKA